MNGQRETDFYFEKDPKNKFSILFIHGLGSNYAFANTLKHSETRWFNMISINLPPSGKSQMEKPFSIENYAHFVEGFINENKIENLYIVGHSMGGAIATFLAGNKKVKKVILISPLHPFFDFKSNRNKLPWLKPSNLEQSVEGTKNLVFNQRIWKGEHFLQKSALDYYEFINNNNLNHLLDQEVTSSSWLKNELLKKYVKNADKIFVISGNEDEYIEKKNLQKTIKFLNLKHEFVPNCGHCPLWEKPQKVLSILKKIVV